MSNTKQIIDLLLTFDKSNIELANQLCSVNNDYGIQSQLFNHNDLKELFSLVEDDVMGFHDVYYNEKTNLYHYRETRDIKNPNYNEELEHDWDTNRRLYGINVHYIMNEHQLQQYILGYLSLIEIANQTGYVYIEFGLTILEYANFFKFTVDLVNQYNLIDRFEIEQYCTIVGCSTEVINEDEDDYSIKTFPLYYKLLHKQSECTGANFRAICCYISEKLGKMTDDCSYLHVYPYEQYVIDTIENVIINKHIEGLGRLDKLIAEPIVWSNERNRYVIHNFKNIFNNSIYGISDEHILMNISERTREYLDNITESDMQYNTQLQQLKQRDKLTLTQLAMLNSKKRKWSNLKSILSLLQDDINSHKAFHDNPIEIHKLTETELWNE